MENIKPEGVLEKHLKNTHNMPGGNGCILTAMREYAQIACSTLSEEIRVKDNEIEFLKSEIKNAIEAINEFQDGGCSKNIKDAKFYLNCALTPPTNP